MIKEFKMLKVTKRFHKYIKGKALKEDKEMQEVTKEIEEKIMGKKTR